MQESELSYVAAEGTADAMAFHGAQTVGLAGLQADPVACA